MVEESLSWNPVGDVKKYLRQISDAASKGRHEIGDAADKGTHEVENVASRAKHEIGTAKNKAIHDLEDQVPMLAEEVLDQIRADLTKLWSSGILDDIVDLAQHAVPGKYPLHLSFLELKVDVNDKIDVLQDLSHNLPSNRKDIIAMVHRLTDDDTIIVHVDARFISSTLGFDFGIPIPVELLTTQGDKVFKRFGL